MTFHPPGCSSERRHGSVPPSATPVSVVVMIDVSARAILLIREICERHGVARLDLTGSAARDDFDPVSSDVDLLVEFLPHANVSAIAFVELSDALEQVFGRRVDLIELDAVRNPILRDAFARDRMPFYAAA